MALVVPRKLLPDRNPLVGSPCPAPDLLLLAIPPGKTLRLLAVVKPVPLPPLAVRPVPVPRLSAISHPCPSQVVLAIQAAQGPFRLKEVRPQACLLRQPRLSAMPLGLGRAMLRLSAAGSKIRIKHRILPIPLASGARPPCRDRRTLALLKAEFLPRVPLSGIPLRIP